MRPRLPLVLLATICATLTGQALAPASRGPAATAAAKQLVRLPSSAHCRAIGSARIVFSPPAGVSFAAISVRVGASEVLQVAGLTGAGSLIVKVPRPGVRVSVTGSTSSGTFFSARRAYKRCEPKPARPKPVSTPQPTPQSGGGGGG